MPFFTSTPDLKMHYRVDDFTDPWTQPDTILLLHGNYESGAAWFGWIPQLARNFRMVRPDMRGFGASTPMPRDFPWTLDIVIDDFIRLMDMLKIDRFHLVGAKIGGTIARAFAARRSERVQTLTVAGTPLPIRQNKRDQLAARIKDLDDNGVEPWIRSSMMGRLGDAFPAEGYEWWIRFMSKTSVSTEIGFTSTISCTDIVEDIRRITCPTLVITTEHSPLGSTEQSQAWQQTIPGSQLLVLPGNSYHVAVSEAEKCAIATKDFILKSRA